MLIYSFNVYRNWETNKICSFKILYRLSKYFKALPIPLFPIKSLSKSITKNVAFIYICAAQTTTELLQVVFPGLILKVLLCGTKLYDIYAFAAGW